MGASFLLGGPWDLLFGFCGCSFCDFGVMALIIKKVSQNDESLSKGVRKCNPHIAGGDMSIYTILPN